jgi:hypothetical protein
VAGLRATLIPHPASPAHSRERLSVEITRNGRELDLRFVVDGNPDLIQWPVSRRAGRSDGLWKHTCFEAFVSTKDGYVEFNLSPSGQWASYRFDGYRQGMRPAKETATVAGMDAGRDLVALEGLIQLPADAVRLGLSAVVEGIDGEKTYWALAHPSDKPDFHHPDSFTLVLPAPAPNREA